VSDVQSPHQTLASSYRRNDTSPDRRADGPFLRRILFGLIAATIFSGAVTIGLTSQHELFERFQVASAHGPA
jgi:hypothetical protein